MYEVGIMAKLIFIVITIGLPIFFILYAALKRKPLILILGVATFTISQLVLRIPLLEYLRDHSDSFLLINATKPILMFAIVALSAGVFEEIGRWIAMRVFMREFTFKNGVIFGMGHGGFEAFILVGLPVVSSYLPLMQSMDLYLSAVERLSAMTVHICFSIIVLVGVKNKKFQYCLLSIFLHGVINFMAGFLMMKTNAIVVEATLVLLSFIIVGITYYIFRRKSNEEINFK